jgi:hypothetical protein
MQQAHLLGRAMPPVGSISVEIDDMVVRRTL